MRIQLPENVTPQTPINTYGHPNVIAEHGYNSECSPCFLGHSHTHAEHFQYLLHKALGEQFGGNWTWTQEREREMHEFEMAWWEENTPFSWDEAYRKTYRW